jgi:guanylate kinase
MQRRNKGKDDGFEGSLIPQGQLYVVAAPSGTGKTSLVKALVESLNNITVSISHTTRTKRPNEIHGINYYFIDSIEFDLMTQRGDFLEQALIFGNRYGTSKRWVEETLAQGIDVILEIDWQGHQQIKKMFSDAVSIFILPPSLSQLRDRLIKRNQDSSSVINNRLKDARETVSHVNEFDYLVINDDFTQALRDLIVIIESGRLTRHRQLEHHRILLDGLKEIS